MPNWCMNEVMISGSANDIRKISEMFGCNNNEFSFKKFLPIPKELQNIQHGCVTIDGKKYFHWRDTKTMPNGEVMTDACIGLTEQEEDELSKKYGACSAYQWQCNNWGTKWDAQLTSQVNVDINDGSNFGDISVNFDTAWSPPEGIYNELVRRFPDVEIDWFYKEPNMRLCGWLGHD